MSAWNAASNAMHKHSAPNIATLRSRHQPHLQLLRAGQAGAVQDQQAAAAAGDGAPRLHHGCLAALFCAAHKQGGGCLRGEEGREGRQAGGKVRSCGHHHCTPHTMGTLAARRDTASQAGRHAQPHHGSNPTWLPVCSPMPPSVAAAASPAAAQAPPAGSSQLSISEASSEQAPCREARRGSKCNIINTAARPKEQHNTASMRHDASAAPRLPPGPSQHPPHAPRPPRQPPLPLPADPAPPRRDLIPQAPRSRCAAAALWPGWRPHLQGCVGGRGDCGGCWPGMKHTGQTSKHKWANTHCTCTWVGTFSRPPNSRTAHTCTQQPCTPPHHAPPPSPRSAPRSAKSTTI